MRIRKTNDFPENGFPDPNEEPDEMNRSKKGSQAAFFISGKAGADQDSGRAADSGVGFSVIRLRSAAI